MDERLFARLATRLELGPVVLASVHETRGATPRKRGSRMLVGALDSEFSVGGGAAEARVIAAARALLAATTPRDALEIDLSGREGAAGICGGRMQIALRRWEGEADAARAAGIAAMLARGDSVALGPGDLGLDHAGFDAEQHRAHPNPRLLVVGAGHCGAALLDLARFLDFDLWLFDARASFIAAGARPGVTSRSGDYARLADAFDSAREVHAVLLNRDYASDVATLRVLAGRPLAFLGMMGSRRRIAEVLAALPEQRDSLRALQAPVGLDIGAHTPHEIAVSILAQLVQWRQRPDGGPSPG